MEQNSGNATENFDNVIRPIFNPCTSTSKSTSTSEILDGQTSEIGHCDENESDFFRRFYLEYCGKMPSRQIDATSKTECGECNMENDKLLETYMQKVNQDQEQLRNDVRASEERTSSNIKSIEERMDNRLNRIEDAMISNQKRLEDKIDNNNKHIQSITYANVGIAIAVIALIVTVIFKIFSGL